MTAIAGSGSTQFNADPDRQHKKVVHVYGVEDASTPSRGHADTSTESISPFPLIDVLTPLLPEERAAVDTFLYEILPVLLENPSKKEAIQRVLETLGQMAGVKDFVPIPRRRWIYVSADQGAISVCMKFLDENRKDGRFGNLRYVLSGGHESMCYQKVVLKLLLDHGYDMLASSFSFKSLLAIRSLFNGFDNHICSDFIRKICRIAGADRICLAWLATNPEDPASANVLRAWTLDRGDDIQFQSHIALCLDVLSAYEMVYKGMRRNRKDVHEAGRKVLLPLVSMLKHRTYTKAVTRDMWEYNWACSPEVRQDRYSFFSIGSRADNKECCDFHVEDQVKNLKKWVTQESPMGFRSEPPCSAVDQVCDRCYSGSVGRRSRARTRPGLSPSLIDPSLWRALKWKT
ncbi:hypothetical protein B484DRAFT_241378 [Ochromonadaceae sp. CCMP2298]|nr:hypothetical protein B484DRAFT_241378 [Ochromonadaceae sp. CCMP2298]|mmetsp:Transcript_14337/g.31614  ORF Transcript_14337/g.31614 Transcript_14337/m.31614 type:complete len:402 (+) Transcript_14337:1353-2558(+)